MRVYEIAKEVGIPNKDLIAKIRALGLEVNNHMSSLDADDVARIRRSLEKEKASVVAPATALFPMVTVVLALLFLKERLGRTQIAGLALAFGAIYLLSM